jgi:glycosyltransferase involved in cell wall biosynthesis
MTEARVSAGPGTVAATAGPCDSRLVVQVVPYYPPHLGGMENVVQGIAEGLASRRRVEVLTTTVGSQGAPRTERVGGVLVRRLRAVQFAHTPVAFSLLPRLLSAPRSAIVHVHISQVLTPEVVWLAAVLRHRPFVAHFHLDVEPSGRLGWLFLIYKRHLLGRTLRAAERVIALSTDQADLIAARYGVGADSIAVVPNAVGPQFCPAPEPRQRRDGPCRLLFVGRISPQKALPRLIRAITTTSQPVDLVVVGDGEDSGSAQRLVRELGLANVRFVGAQRGEELVCWYRWADVFVLPSDVEGMPLVMLEAMAVGLPIVATDVPGSRETLGDAGLLAAPDPKSLGRAIDRVAGDCVLRAELSRRSLLAAREHTWARLVERLEAIYDDVPGPAGVDG